MGLSDPPSGRCGLGGKPCLLYCKERQAGAGRVGFCQECAGRLGGLRTAGYGFIRSYVPVPKTDPWAIRQAAALINNAKRPFILVGQGVELGGAQEEARQLIERADIPAVALCWACLLCRPTIR